MKEPEIKLDVLALREEWRKLDNYGCFWSSPDNPRGLRLTPNIEAGRLSVEMEIEREHSGFPGIAHGGIAFTILDGLMGWFIMSHYGRAGFTTNCSTQYKGPLHVGKKYLFQVTVSPLEGDGKTVSLVGEVFPAQNTSAKSLVKMTADFMMPSRMIAEKVLQIELGNHGKKLFPEE